MRELHHQTTGGDDVLPESFYADGGISWGVGRANKLPQTKLEAVVASGKAVKRLRKYGKGDPVLIALADRLKACKPKRRCNSGACPKCARARQKSFVVRMKCFMETAREPWCVVTIVPAIRMAMGDTDVMPKLRKFRHKLDKAFKSAGIRNVIGVFDFAANEHHDGHFAAHYRIHLWCMIPASQIVSGKAALKRWFRSNATIKRPVKVQAFDGDIRAFAYGFKPEFQRRVTLAPVLVLDGSTSKGQFTRPRALRATQAVELCFMSDQMGSQGRLCLWGVPLSQFTGQSEALARPSHSSWLSPSLRRRLEAEVV